jgi:staphyloferrin B biosynthesis citrate synthase
MAGHRAAAAGVTVIAQIEDADALPHIDAIAATPGLDALFIGRADLTVSLGCASSDDAPVVAAVEAICAAGRKNGRAVGMFLARSADIAHWREKGATLFILASDQEFLLQGAAKLAKSVHS